MSRVCVFRRATGNFQSGIIPEKSEPYEPTLFESYTQAHLDTCFMDIVK